MKGAAGQLRVPPQFMAQTRIPLAPLPEQHRIVAEIEKQFTRLDAAVAALKRVQANAKRYRASVLKAACEGRLVPTEAELAKQEGRTYEPASELLARILTERRTPASKRPVSTDTNPRLAEGWCLASLTQLGELARGKSKHRPRNDPRLMGGPFPFIQTGDVTHSGGFIRSHTQTYSEFGLAQSRLWPAGTLCITIAANIAGTGILTYPACFPDSVVGFRCEPQPIVVRFVEYQIRNVRDELTKLAPATAQKNINLKILSELAIPLPPLAEQYRIVAEVERRLSRLDALETAVQHALKRAARLRQSILKRAFSGQLVPQNPNDEPASQLLERIRADRAAQTAAKPKRRAVAKCKTTAPKTANAAPKSGG